uniref:Ig-like domain-containing protein n=1 Tax=Chrysemys picta bellii TaxID=8478 RepID=A0A8C3H6B5_CHRPI
RGWFSCVQCKLVCERFAFPFFLDIFELLGCSQSHWRSRQGAVSIDVTEGDPATLQCRFSGTKDIAAKWFKDGKELTLGPKYKISVTDQVSALKIVHTEKKDSGEYTFEVQNDVGSSSSNTLLLLCWIDLIIPPKFTKKLKKMDSIKGSFIHLECIVSGSHPIKLKPKWFKDGKQLLPSRYYTMSFDSNVASFRIESVMKEDSGTYAFKVENDFGSSTCEAVLTVLGLYFAPLHFAFFVEKNLIASQIPGGNLRCRTLTLVFAILLGRSNNPSIIYQKVNENRSSSGIVYSYGV